MPIRPPTIVVDPRDDSGLPDLPEGPWADPPPPPPVTPLIPDRDPNLISPTKERIQCPSAQGGTVPVIYGPDERTGCSWIYFRETSNILYAVAFISRGPIESIGTIKIDDRTLADLGFILNTHYHIHLGIAGDTTDSFITETGDSYADVCPEYSATVVFKFPKPNQTTGNYNPFQFEAIVDGRLLYNVVTSLTETTASANPILQVWDAITNTRYGLGRPSSEIRLSAAQAAANICDFDIDPGAGTTKRWTCTMKVDKTAPFRSWVDTWRLHFLGAVTWSEEFVFIADQPKSASAITLEDSGVNANCDRPFVETKGTEEIPTILFGDWTDTANNYRDDVPITVPPSLPVGTEWIERRFNLRGFRTVEMVRRALTQLYDRLHLDKTGTYKCMQVALEIEPGDRIFGKSRRLIKPTDTPPNTGSVAGAEDLLVSNVRMMPYWWEVDWELYRDSIYDDTIDTTPPPGPLPPLPDPFAPPPNPTGAVVVEVVGQGPNGISTSRLQIDWTNAITPFYRGTRVWVNLPLNVATTSTAFLGEFGGVSGGPGGPVFFENPVITALHTITLKTVNFKGIESSGVVLTITPDMFPDFVPAPGRMYDVGDGSTYWAEPPNLVAVTLYGASFWTNSNFPSFVAAEVNDGDMTTTAFTLNTALAATVTLDLGVGNSKAFRGFRISASVAFDSSESPVVLYSDDGAAWVNLPFGGPTDLENIGAASADLKHMSLQWDATVGSHRWWQYWRTSSFAQPTTVVELQFYEIGSPALYPFVTHYEIRDVSTYFFPGLLIKSVPAASRPTASSRLQLLEAISPQNSVMSLHLCAVNTAGAKSNSSFSQITAQLIVDSATARIQAATGPLTLQPGGFAAERSVGAVLQLPSNPLSLSNGDNNNVAISSYGTQRITGPTAAYAITGLVTTNTLDGDVGILWNATAYVMTLKMANAGSSAANRLVGAADVAVSADGGILAQYDATTGRWRVIGGTGSGGGGGGGMGTLKWEADAITTLSTTALNSLASGVAVVTTEYDNATNLNLFGDFELVVTFPTAPVLGTLVEAYLVQALDGTNYADASTTVFVASHYRFAFPVRDVTSAQRIVVSAQALPPTKFKVQVINSTDQDFDSTANTLKMVGYREQNV